MDASTRQNVEHGNVWGGLPYTYTPAWTETERVTRTSAIRASIQAYATSLKLGSTERMALNAGITAGANQLRRSDLRLKTIVK